MEELSKFFFPFKRVDKSREIDLDAIRKEHADQRKRIKKMKDELIAASMNGEEKWFLTSTTEDCDHE